MGNAKRLAILIRLLDNEIPVGQLASFIDLSQSALSQHLAKLRDLDLVHTRRDAQTIYCSARNHAIRRILEALTEVYSGLPLEIRQAG